MYKVLESRINGSTLLFLKFSPMAFGSVLLLDIDFFLGGDQVFRYSIPHEQLGMTGIQANESKRGYHMKQN